jgi:hypothetical protein
VGQGKAMHGSRQTSLPVEAIEKTLDVLAAVDQRVRLAPSRRRDVCSARVGVCCCRPLTELRQRPRYGKLDRQKRTVTALVRSW